MGAEALHRKTDLLPSLCIDSRFLNSSKIITDLTICTYQTASCHSCITSLYFFNFELLQVANRILLPLLKLNILLLESVPMVVWSQLHNKDNMVPHI